MRLYEFDLNETTCSGGIATGGGTGFAGGGIGTISAPTIDGKPRKKPKKKSKKTESKPEMIRR